MNIADVCKTINEINDSEKGGTFVGASYRKCVKYAINSAYKNMKYFALPEQKIKFMYDCENTDISFEEFVVTLADMLSKDGFDILWADKKTQFIVSWENDPLMG